MGVRRNKSFLNSQSRLCVWGEGDSLLSVSLSSHQKNANHCIQRVPKLGNKRRYIHKKPHQESGLYTISYARYSEKRITQIYKALYGDAMLVSLEGHIYGYWKSTETSVFEFCYKCMNLSLKEIRKIKVIFILRQGMFR